MGLGETEGDAVPQGVGESDGVSEVLVECVPDRDALAQKLLDTVADRDREGELEKLADDVGLGENVVDAVPQGVCESDGVAEVLTECVPDRVALAQKLLDTVAERDRDGEDE